MSAMVPKDRASVQYSEVKQRVDLMTLMAIKRRVERKAKKYVCWIGPASMVGALVAALAFSLAHHFFYNSLNGRLVEETQLSQQWLIRIGTLFAFLVKMSLTVATTIAYTQQQWLTLGSRSFPISQVDSMFGVLKHISLFSDLKVWIRNPVLASIAALTWYNLLYNSPVTS